MKRSMLLGVLAVIGVFLWCGVAQAGGKTDASPKNTLDEMLKKPTLVWAMSCDSGHTVLAKHKTSPDATLFVWWTDVSTTSPVMLNWSEAFVIFMERGEDMVYARGFNPETRPSYPTRNEFFSELAIRAPKGSLFIDRKTRQSSLCTPLKINASE